MVPKDISIVDGTGLISLLFVLVL